MLLLISTFFVQADVSSNAGVTSTKNSSVFDKFKTIPSANVGAERYQDLSIEADYVNYLEKNQYVEATGNVLLVYKDYRVTASNTLLNTGTEQVYINKGFVLDRSRERITGENLFYDFQDEEGYASQIDMKLHKNFMKGKNVIIKKDQIIIEDAWQTTCSENKKCHHITAKQITVYPEWGDVVAEHAVFHAFQVPVLYIPNYIINSQDSAGNMMNSVIPELGSNPIEGSFIKGRLGYYKNEKMNGTIDLHFLEKLGTRIGFNNNYKLDQSQRGQLRLHYLSGLGGRFSYGWQHRLLLGVPYKTKWQIIDEFFKGVMPPSNEEYPELVVDVTSRELIKYQWISFKPQVTLISPTYETFLPELYSRVNISGANIYEEGRFEGNKQYNKSYWDYYMYRDFSLNEYGRLKPSLTYSKAGYYEYNNLRGAWKRFYYNLDYYKDFWRFDLRVGYKNTFSESGFSPFEYDTFNVSTPEETNYTIFYKITDRLRVSYHEDYSLTDHKLRNKDYGMYFKVCCWEMGFTWYDTESRFIFNINLQ